MIINEASLKGLFSGFSTAFNKGFEGADSHYQDVAMVVPSTTRETTYGWMGLMNGICEWIGDRHIHNLAAHGYTIANKDFEQTLSVPRNDIEDDQYGVFGPLMTDMGREAGEFPDKLVFDLMTQGFTTPCYDGQTFLSPDHAGTDADGKETTVSNIGDGGDEPAWFLLDTSRAMRPFVYQERKPFELVALTDSHQEHVFFRNEYVYGAHGRANAGFGLWQLAYASREPLTATTYAVARQAMHQLRGENGRLLGIRPTTLVVPTALERPALQLIRNQVNTAGATNEWYQSANLIITPWLEA